MRRHINWPGCIGRFMGRSFWMLSGGRAGFLTTALPEGGKVGISGSFEPFPAFLF